MLAVVVSILAFVVGVVVGRDSPDADSGAAGAPAPAAPVVAPDPPRLVIVGEPEDDPTASALEEVTYPDRLRSDGPVEERLRGLPLYAGGAASPTPAPEPAAAPEAGRPAAADPPTEATSPAEESPPAEVASPVEAASPAEGTALAEANPAADATSDAVAEASAAAPPPAVAEQTVEAEPYTVQVAALRAAAAADAFAGRLLAKGFPAYVVEPSPGGPVAMYRVRVGRYANHSEAERVRRRLEQEEQLTPWITR